MILTTHAIVGAAIGKNIGNPFFIIIFSIIGHFVLDTFRHGEYLDTKKATIKNTAWKVILDLMVGGFVVLYSFYLYKDNFILIRNIFLGSFFSMFPDLLTVLFWITRSKILEKIYNFHATCHFFPLFSKERSWTLQNTQNDILFSLVATIVLFL